MSENGRNEMQQMEILNLGKLLNLVTNVTKVKIRRLEKLHKSLITNAYDIIFNRTCMNERLLPNFTNIYIYITKKNRYLLDFFHYEVLLLISSCALHYVLS